jgi:hypothetical protein
MLHRPGKRGSSTIHQLLQVRVRRPLFQDILVLHKTQQRKRLPLGARALHKTLLQETGSKILMALQRSRPVLVEGLRLRHSN